MGLRWVWMVAVVVALAAAPADAACTARPTTASDLALCSGAATAGDAVAAVMLADALANPAGNVYDPAAAAIWWERAASAGNITALRRLFDARWYGRGLEKDQVKARTYLDRAVALGAPWARLVRALLMEAEDAGAAAELYASLAAEGNCHAQLRLAHGHDRGGWLEKNRAQALYWALVAASAGRDPVRTESHPLFESRFHYDDCVTEAFFFKDEVAKSLPASLRANVETAAMAWRPGRLPDRQGPVEVPSALGVPPAGHGATVPGAVRLPEWHPLPLALRRSPGKVKVGAEELFATVGRSVHVVVAARNDEELKAQRVRFGSAVAMDERTLVTNCHVIDEMPVIWLRQGGQVIRAVPSGGDGATDRCQLTVSPGRLSAVPGVRPWEDLRVGETVYSIGAPKGLEATLGQGLISGLRTIKGVRYVQTSAPISPGSSGGGLFDAAGNLIGITTFHFRDADGLNFAIAADDYFR